MAALLEKAYSWGFVSGRVNVLERGLLTQEFYQSLLAHQRTEDLLRHLQESPLRDAVNAAGTWVDWSAIVDQHFYEQVASLRKDCPDVRLPDLFLLQGDYQNLKRALTKRTVYPFPHAVLTPELLASAAAISSRCRNRTRHWRRRRLSILKRARASRNLTPCLTRRTCGICWSPCVR